MNPYWYSVGLDIGQVNDNSALCIIEEQIWDPRPDDENPEDAWKSPASIPTQRIQWMLANDMRRWPGRPKLHVRHLERFPLGTAYPEMVRQVVERLRHPAIQQLGFALILDNTGVGRPISDLFKPLTRGVVPITITGSPRARRDRRTGEWTVGKRLLVSAAQVALQTHRLRLPPSLPETATLVQELANYRVTIDERTAHDSYNARSGAHDDLVLSVAMAVWYRDYMFRDLDTSRTTRAQEIAA